MSEEEKQPERLSDILYEESGRWNARGSGRMADDFHLHAERARRLEKDCSRFARLIERYTGHSADCAWHEEGKSCDCGDRT